MVPRKGVSAKIVPVLIVGFCSIHLDLLAAKLIPDPFIGQNEASLQWIHGRTWVYTTMFETTVARQDERVDLVFEGLDTFATVKLNGEEVLKCVQTTGAIACPTKPATDHSQLDVTTCSWAIESTSDTSFASA